MFKAVLVSWFFLWAMFPSYYKPSILNSLCFFPCVQKRGFFCCCCCFFSPWFSVSIYSLWFSLTIMWFIYLFLMVCRVSKHNNWEQTFTILQTEKHSCVVCHLFWSLFCYWQCMWTIERNCVCWVLNNYLQPASGNTMLWLLSLIMCSNHIGFPSAISMEPRFCKHAL